MGSERWVRNAFGGTGEILRIIVVASLIMALSVVTSWAGDILSQPADSITVTQLLSQGALLCPGERRLGLAGFIFPILGPRCSGCGRT
jgi:hypothetical protein